MLASIRRLEDQVLDELNVKSLEPLADPGRFVTYGIRPNLRTLGPRLGKQLNAVREGLASLPPADVAAKVEAGQPVDVDTPSGAVSLAPDDILVDLVRIPGYAAAQGPNSTVVLDTSLTPELIAEGLARDFVRGIQDGRKQAGYRIEDTIEIVFEADPEAKAAVEAHRDYVMAETLATSLEGDAVIGASDALEPETVEGPGGAVTSNGVFLDQIEAGGHQIRIALRRS